MVNIKEIMELYNNSSPGTWSEMGPKVVSSWGEEEPDLVAVMSNPRISNSPFITLMHNIAPEICKELDILRGSIEKYKGLASCVLSGASVEECIETGMCVECPFSSNDEACYEITKKGVS